MSVHPDIMLGWNRTRGPKRLHSMSTVCTLINAFLFVDLFFQNFSVTFILNISVDEPGIPVILSSKSILLEKSSNQFRCSASKGKPDHIYKWKIGEKPLNGQETLTFTPSYLDNGKNLSCMVTNNYTQVKRKSLTANLTIYVECK